MSLDDRVNLVTQRLRDAGVVDVKFAWSETLREDVASGKVTKEEVLSEVTDILDSYLDGNGTPLVFNDSTWDDTTDMEAKIQMVKDIAAQFPIAGYDGTFDKTGLRPDQVSFYEALERGDHLRFMYNDNV